MTLECSPARVPPESQRPALILWTIAAMVLGFLALVHVGVLLCFLTTVAALPLVAPTALAAAVWMGDHLGRREGLRGRDRWWPVGSVLGMTFLAVGISAAFYDLSWDGQWYHQNAIYGMIQGWNPLFEPMRAFAGHNELWIRHYAKGPWYIGTAMAALTGQIEAGKFQTWLAMGAVFAAVVAACLDGGLRRTRALALGCVVALNPVAISEVLSFLVDGLMVCYLACYVAALFGGFRRASPLIVFVGAASAVCSINTKFTGLVFLCMICAGAGLYLLVSRRDLFWRFVGLNLGAIGLGTIVLGFNPYVTNAIHRSHPFYPLAGSRAFPSLAEQGEDPIETGETPPNMKGRPRLVRLGYAVFGRPGFPPYNGEPVARLMWPFAVHPGDWAVYRFHDVRIAGLGPFFSGALVLGLILSCWLLWTSAAPRFLLLLGLGVVVATLLSNVHMWWARYSPHLWWIPILPAVMVFWRSRSRWQVRLAWSVVGLLLVDALIVTAVRLQWEVQATRTLQRQLVDLRSSGRTIDVDLMFFGGSVGERLRTWGIPFEPARLGRAPDRQELMSVARGNPGGVLYRFSQSRPTSGSLPSGGGSR
jgi:hypothetical protein